MPRHYMKDPEDLDSFSDEQGPITAILDAGGKKKIYGLVNLAMTLMEQADTTITRSGFSLGEWQRAVYEMSQISKADPTKNNVFVKDMLWMILHYIQESHKAAMMRAEDPELQKQFSGVLGKN